MEDAPKSSVICCCQAKLWGVFIGLYRLITAGLLLILAVSGKGDRALTIAFVDVDDTTTEDDTASSLRMIHTLLFLYSVLELYMSCLLLAGIKQACFKKITIWLFYQTICILLPIVLFFKTLLSDHDLWLFYLIPEILGFLFSCFFWWVAKVHLNELKAEQCLLNGGGGVSSDPPKISSEMELTAIELKE